MDLNTTTELKKIGDVLKVPFDSVEGQIRKEISSGGISKDNIQIISRDIEKISKALPKFTGSIKDVMEGVFDIVSACSTLIPIGGMYVRNITYLASTVLCLMGGCKKDMSLVVNNVIDNALRKYEDRGLRMEAVGMAKDFAVSQAFLQGMQQSGCDIKGWDVAAMAANVPVTKGVPFLAKLTGVIKDLITVSKTATSEEQRIEGCKKIYEYTQMYCQIAILRDAVLWNMYSITLGGEMFQSIAKGIENVIRLEQQHDESALEFLFSPDQENVFIRSVFDPEIWSFVYTFLDNRGLSRKLFTAEIEKKSVAIRSLKWMDWHISCGTGSGLLHTLRDQRYPRVDKGSPEANGLLYFYQKENEIYYYLSIYGQKGRFLKISQDGNWLIVDKTAPGPEGEWKVVRLGEGKYLLSTKKWPLRFLAIYPSPHDCLSFDKGYPGPHCQWMIEPCRKSTR